MLGLIPINNRIIKPDLSMPLIHLYLTLCERPQYTDFYLCLLYSTFVS